MAFDFKGKVAFITGGGTGIGAAVAQAFVQGGGRVVLMGRRRQPLQAVADPLGGLVVEGDAANADDVRVALARAQEQFGAEIGQMFADIRVPDILANRHANHHPAKDDRLR